MKHTALVLLLSAVAVFPSSEPSSEPSPPKALPLLQRVESLEIQLREQQEKLDHLHQTVFGEAVAV